MPKPQPISDSEASVGRVEAFNKVMYQSGKAGKILLWLLGASIWLTMFAQIIRAISRPFIGKLAKITSRPTTYVVILAFYAVGFAVAASARNFASYTVGICFNSVGKSGLDLLSDIIVADLTPLQWRGFFSASLSLPFVVTVPINGFIAEGFVDNWRWDLGMFAILVPALLVPAIITLYAMQRRGEKAGMVTLADSRDVRTGAAEATPKSLNYWAKLAYQGFIEIDIIGLIILGFAFSLILLFFTLAKDSDGGWSNPSMIAMITMGFVSLIVFVGFEVFVAPKPIMTKRVINNRAFIAGEWTTYEWTIFLGITTMGLSLVGPFVGLIHRVSHRYKNVMVFGAAAKVIGYAILVQSNGNMTQDTGRLIASQLLFCLSSLNVVGARVGVQASVPQEDVAPGMFNQLPGVSSDAITEIYGDIKALRTDYDFLDPIRQGSIRAYAIVNGNITVASICLSAIPLIASFFMPNYYLGKQQNAINNRGVDGEVVDVPDEHQQRQVAQREPGSLWQRVLAWYSK
ncbi:hypothetical protein BJX70DRAFT_388411 [Aspergillus crustosus]